MNADSSKIWLLHTILFLVFLKRFSSAGTCWSAMTKHNSGRCTEFLADRISKEHCCSSNNLASTAWSPDDFDPRTLFFWRVVGAPCMPCKGSCKNVKCETEKSCVVRKGIAKCVCSTNCKGEKKRLKGPVCGTDGRTYKSWCRMKKKSCKLKEKVSVDYYGICQDSCDNVRCSDGKTCLRDQNHVPHCVHCSRRKCSDYPKYRVCGSDGLTYKSPCFLRLAACLGGKAIPIAYKGRCKEKATCADVHCPDFQRCVIDKEGGGQPRCVTCNACRPKHLHGPVCGTNNSTYPSWCDMMRDSCNKGYLIDTKHSGKCNKE